MNIHKYTRRCCNCGAQNAIWHCQVCRPIMRFYNPPQRPKKDHVDYGHCLACHNAQNHEIHGRLRKPNLNTRMTARVVHTNGQTLPYSRLIGDYRFKARSPREVYADRSIDDN